MGLFVDIDCSKRPLLVPLKIGRFINFTAVEVTQKLVSFPEVSMNNYEPEVCNVKGHKTEHRTQYNIYPVTPLVQTVIQV